MAAEGAGGAWTASSYMFNVKAIRLHTAAATDRGLDPRAREVLADAFALMWRKAVCDSDAEDLDL